MMAWITEGTTELNAELTGLITHQREKWARATEEKKQTWRVMKQEKFTRNPLNARLVEVLASFEVRWLPLEMDTCPVCREQGKTVHCRQGDDFKEHMKDCHETGWRNVKDEWCTMFSKAMVVTIARKGAPLRQGVGDIELSNCFLACPHPKCKWNHNHGLDHHKHYTKAHENKGPEIGIWETFVLMLRKNPGATVGEFLGKTGGICAHAGLSRSRKSRC
jgi:hypothetical protein